MQCRKGEEFLGGGVTADAVLAEPGIRVIEGIVIAIDSSTCAVIAPEPAVLGAAAVAHHVGPHAELVVDLVCREIRITRGGRGEHLLDDHRPIGNVSLTAVFQPFVDFR